MWARSAGGGVMACCARAMQLPRTTSATAQEKPDFALMQSSHFQDRAARALPDMRGNFQRTGYPILRLEGRRRFTGISILGRVPDSPVSPIAPDFRGI